MSSVISTEQQPIKESSHRSILERRHPCQECGQQYTQKESLTPQQKLEYVINEQRS